MRTMGVAGVIATLLAACAAQPADPAREYRREDARVRAVEQFEARKHRCAARGGVMRIPRQSSGRFPPTVSELRTATCAPGGNAGLWLP